jgi:hypothetical protein
VTRRWFLSLLSVAFAACLPKAHEAAVDEFPVEL